MGMIDWSGIVIAVIGVISSMVSYVVGKRQRQNDFLGDLQQSIDLLSKKNSELIDEVVKLRGENAKLLSNQDALQYQIDKLTKQNERLQKEVEDLNSKLENVKTITRTK